MYRCEDECSRRGRHTYTSPYDAFKYLNINLLDLIATENNLMNNCHSNSLTHVINKPPRNANNNPSITDHIWTNQLYDTLNGIFY